jgi:hypothetical protein
MTNIDEQPENHASDDAEGEGDVAIREAVSDGRGHELAGDDNASVGGDTVSAANLICLSSDLHI